MERSALVDFGEQLATLYERLKGEARLGSYEGFEVNHHGKR
jgi:hypothetical protein